MASLLKFLNIWKCLQAHLKVSVILPTGSLPTSYLSTTSTALRSSTLSDLLKGCVPVWAHRYLLTYLNGGGAPILIVSSKHLFVELLVLESELFSNLLPRLGPQRFLTIHGTVAVRRDMQSRTRAGAGKERNCAD